MKNNSDGFLVREKRIGSNYKSDNYKFCRINVHYFTVAINIK